ncbi:TPA: alpha/beta fold hydrolase [Aeromonas salmonicida]|uniref:alpha/beta fold hydrolase n=1 Tax=Aeromonas salmonicida TaxID=645 RepID=UPI002861A503|nr:alpha/beta fold hydrolase [Aeromonas salmonicida]MDR6994533.1 alpha-beta hydrolase superfamily lysophospholipase [Aeromonas salmonicida]HEH9412180.1 alpha/beta fold hydrolase [Aeromonas salmonicida]HEH9420998.1 alpha/beta fold hydrolase [Aeromonas salmonicida]HEH9434247.1 alpha/beta fold hydrolase [Aeromonas salmonicida]
MNTELLCVLGLLSLGLVTLVAALLFGGPGPAPEMASISNPFKTLDWSGLPPLSRYPARDGAELAYRHYAPAGKDVRGSVVLVHGSSASSQSMHILASAFSQAGYGAYTLDIRGHGESGQRGTIAYIGQLEDDLEDFSAAVTPSQPTTLAGFSSGGGFVLRVAGGSRQTLFDNYLLLSPYLGPTAANYRPNSGGWVSVGLPRLIALTILNGLHVSALNHLTVLNFALNDEAKALLTPSYSFNLASNFQPERDYRQNLRNVKRPCAVIAGADDETFKTDQLAPELSALGIQWPVTLVPGISHIPLILDSHALAAAVQAVEKMTQ